MFKNYDDYTLALVLKAYLFHGKSHRSIQKEILNIPAPARGGGFKVMEILHFFNIKGEHKSTYYNRVSESIFDERVEHLLKELSEAEEMAEKDLENNINPKGLDTSKKRFIATRVYQNKLRDKVFQNYNYRCAICEIDKLDLLVCSHIIPWSLDEDNRLNLENSICLCTMHDKLFDKGYFCLEEDYKIKLSRRVDGNLSLFFQDKKFKRPLKFGPNPTFLKFHREEIFD